MDHRSIDLTLVIDIFLLLLIGIGPKIALVPFLDVTADFDASTKQSMVRKMLKDRRRRRGPLGRRRRTAGETAAFLDRIALDRRRHHPRDHRGDDDPPIRRTATRSRAAIRCGSRCSRPG